MATKKRRWRRVLWTRQDVQTLRKRAGLVKVAGIARELKRSPQAVRFKCHTLGVSLAMRK